MASVTQNARPISNVNGAVREIYFPDITVVTTGDTLFVPFRTVMEMTINDPAGITKMTRATSGAGSLVTFTGTTANGVFKASGQ